MCGRLVRVFVVHGGVGISVEACWRASLIILGMCLYLV